MKFHKLAVTSAVVLAFLIGGALAGSEEAPTVDMKKVMKIITPGEMHKLLAYDIGTWDVEATLVMPGLPPQAPSKLVSESKWIMKGRWVSEEVKGMLMGLPYHAFGLSGYDNHTKNFVYTGVTNMDTAMNTFRGVQVDPENKVFTMYGTINEYMDGTFNKPVKVVTRRIDADHFVRDIWDLQIGENGSRVLTFKFTRRP